MNGIKILLITGTIFVGLYFFMRLRNSLFDLLLLFLLITAAIIFVIFPDLTNQLAHWLGVGRGADLVFYVSILIFWFAILKLYARVRKLEQYITTIIRKDALDDVKESNS